LKCSFTWRRVNKYLDRQIPTEAGTIKIQYNYFFSNARQKISLFGLKKCAKNEMRKKLSITLAHKCRKNCDVI